MSLRNEIWNVDLDLIWEIFSTAHAREASHRKDHVLLRGDRLHSLPSQVVLTTWSWLVLVLESMSILKWLMNLLPAALEDLQHQRRSLHQHPLESLKREFLCIFVSARLLQFHFWIVCFLFCTAWKTWPRATRQRFGSGLVSSRFENQVCVLAS